MVIKMFKVVCSTSMLWRIVYWLFIFSLSSKSLYFADSLKIAVNWLCLCKTNTDQSLSDSVKQKMYGCLISIIVLRIYGKEVLSFLQIIFPPFYTHSSLQADQGNLFCFYSIQCMLPLTKIINSFFHRSGSFYSKPLFV